MVFLFLSVVSTIISATITASRHCIGLVVHCGLCGSLVKQSEATLMMKEIGWRRLKEEVKTLESWKLKAKTLEDCVLKQNSMIGVMSLYVCMYVCLWKTYLYIRLCFAMV